MNAKSNPFNNECLVKLPLAYRYLKKRKTDSIGELYLQVRFSQSHRHRTMMLNNYPDFKPLSGIEVY